LTRRKTVEALKALFCYNPVPSYILQPGSMANVITALPETEVIECHDYKSMMANLSDADFLFFTQLSMMAMSDQENEEILKLNDMKEILILYTSLDPWTPPRFDRRRRCDLLIHTVLRSYLRDRREYPMIWLPMACDLHYPKVGRDLDILVWGKVIANKYPFRQFISEQIKELLVKTTVINKSFQIGTIEIGGKEYTAGILNNDSAAYYGDGLYNMLCRSRISLTGPHGYKMAVGKYVENAACGVVSLTCDFEDRLSLGYEHGKHLWITDQDTFRQDLQFLLEHPDLVADIGAEAQMLVKYRHTPLIRAWQLRDYLFIASRKG